MEVNPNNNDSRVQNVFVIEELERSERDEAVSRLLDLADNVVDMIGDPIDQELYKLHYRLGYGIEKAAWDVRLSMTAAYGRWHTLLRSVSEAVRTQVQKDPQLNGMFRLISSDERGFYCFLVSLLGVVSRKGFTAIDTVFTAPDQLSDERESTLQFEYRPQTIAA